MTRPLASGVLVGVLLLALTLGGLASYCVQRAERDTPPPSTPAVIVVPATEPPAATPTETPYAPFLFESLQTALPTATVTSTPEATPVPPTETPRPPTRTVTIQNG